MAMTDEFHFVVVDANQLVERQQNVVRELLTQKLDLTTFRRKERAGSAPPPREITERFKAAEVFE
jgi:hypothetical protein